MSPTCLSPPMLECSSRRFMVCVGALKSCIKKPQEPGPVTAGTAGPVDGSDQAGSAHRECDDLGSATDHVVGTPARQASPKLCPVGGRESWLEAGSKSSSKHVSMLKSALLMCWLLMPMLIEWLGLPGLVSFQHLYTHFASAMQYENADAPPSSTISLTLFTKLTPMLVRDQQIQRREPRPCGGADALVVGGDRLAAGPHRLYRKRCVAGRPGHSSGD
jgi:hypothetical protein